MNHSELFSTVNQSVSSTYSDKSSRPVLLIRGKIVFSAWMTIGWLICYLWGAKLRKGTIEELIGPCFILRSSLEISGLNWLAEKFDQNNQSYYYSTHSNVLWSLQPISTFQSLAKYLRCHAESFQLTINGSYGILEEYYLPPPLLQI